ncbi:HypC/HybG/HupF family hydrogenase formation chaperone [Prochlorothrix hollandica]|uniref:Hydrogenase assembly protein HupF n=1 Tax=Prochlorothrix hollandica PCC 9006 = CALU 1027 TaxID=317619 RepID=A0A0M2PR30_PROHO|nr:HypC/HybG/HupF family hydrogenase formation chaperone [Prochlorothrix hollandica]KKI98995.1 hydrogenase assembly protein HupF [Prochlorothrix hollandica PCC 9006 = CALU 1027]
MCLAIPGQLMSIATHDDPLNSTGKVSFGGVLREVSLAYVPEATVGDYVIVHVGFALTMLSQEEALATLQDLQQLETV